MLLWRRTSTRRTCASDWLDDDSPRGPVPPAVPFAIAVITVMVLGFALDAVSLFAVALVSLVALAYVAFTWRAGTSAGSEK